MYRPVLNHRINYWLVDDAKDDSDKLITVEIHLASTVRRCDVTNRLLLARCSARRSIEFHSRTRRSAATIDNDATTDVFARPAEFYDVV